MSSRDKKVYENPQYKTVFTKPSTPDTGFTKIYPKEDGHWYTLDSSGCERPVDDNVIGSGAGECSTVRIGGNNESSGDYSSINGGVNNSSRGLGSTIGGGVDNTVNSKFSTIGGGYGNEDKNAAKFSKQDSFTTIAGGKQNKVFSIGSTVGGGSFNSAEGSHSTIGGGNLNHINYFVNTCGKASILSHSTIGGGCSNGIWGDYGSIGGGFCNQIFDERGGSGSACDNAGTIGGGECNKIFHSLPYNVCSCHDICNTIAYGGNTIAGGYGNVAGFEYQKWEANLWNGSSGFSTIGGGYSNKSTNVGSTVGGGTFNVAAGKFSTVSGGGGVTGDGNESLASYGTIAGGAKNKIDNELSFNRAEINPENIEILKKFLKDEKGTFNIISGGKCNTIKGGNIISTISGGFCNTIDSNFSSIVSGCKNNILNGHNNSIIAGSNINSVQENTLHINNLSISDKPEIDKDNTNVLVRKDNTVIGTRSMGGYFVELETSQSANTNQAISLIADDPIINPSRGRRKFTTDDLKQGDTYQFLMSGILNVGKDIDYLNIFINLGPEVINIIRVPFNTDYFNSSPYGGTDYSTLPWKLSGEFTVKRESNSGPGSGKPIISNAEFRTTSIIHPEKRFTSGEVFIGGMDNRFTNYPSPLNGDIVFDISASWDDAANDEANSRGIIYSTSFVLTKIY